MYPGVLHDILLLLSLLDKWLSMNQTLLYVYIFRLYIANANTPGVGWHDVSSCPGEPEGCGTFRSFRKTEASDDE